MHQTLAAKRSSVEAATKSLFSALNLMMLDKKPLRMCVSVMAAASGWWMV
jgi:hypothetical protein